MAALCLSASVEMLWPLCCHCTHCLQGDLWCCLYEGSLQALQVVVMLSASHVLQNSPQFTVQGVEVWTPKGQFLALLKARRFLQATPESSWPCGQELNLAGRPIPEH